MSAWIDVHTHLNMLKDTPEDAIARAKSAGVEKIITIGTNPEDHTKVIEFAEKFAPDVWCTIGVHPHDAEKFPEDESLMLSQAKHERCLAVGEIGLDYYYDNAPREKQKEVFRRQLEIAEELDLPFEIHTRDAEQDTVDILNDFRGRIRGMIHCFTGTQWLAEKALDLGHNISCSGIVTFKSADDLRDVARYVPMDRIHVETDAPFLTPVPHRGKSNEPMFTATTGEFVAQLKGVEVSEFQAQTRKNAEDLFKTKFFAE